MNVHSYYLLKRNPLTPRYKDDNRQQMMADTRTRLMNAAVQEFAREGYEAASINRITQSAGVATGTIYNYFPGKKELMLAVLSEFGAAHCAYIDEQIHQVDDLVLRMKCLMDVCFDYVKDNPHQSKVLFAMMQGTNRIFKEHLCEVYQPMFNLIVQEILVPGMQQGIFQVSDPVSTTMMIMTFYLGVGSTVDDNGETPIDLKEVAGFVLRALGAKPVKAE
jgi:AcrR family transcriptional regulator